MPTVLITGCSSGIGRLTTQRFAAHGWNVAATARHPETLAALEAPNVAALALDVTDEASIARAVAATVERFGTIDVLVNNAGYGVFGPLEAMSAGQLEQQFKVNVFGLAAVTRHVLPVMRRQHRGTIVNVSSLGGRFGSPFFSAYYSSKHAVEGLSESLRYELKAHGIRVKLIEPAHFKTGFISSLEWVTLSSYEPQIDTMKSWVVHQDRKAPPADPIAEMVFKAATDPSDRLRYPVRGRIALAIHAVLPDAVWRAMMGAGMSRRPRS